MTVYYKTLLVCASCAQKYEVPGMYTKPRSPADARMLARGHGWTYEKLDLCPECNKPPEVQP